MSATITQLRTGDRGLASYLTLISGDQRAGSLIEIRCAAPGGEMRRLFVPARTPERAARVIAALAPRADVYVGVGLRRRRAGGRDALEPAHLAFVEIDSADSGERLERFAHQPSIVIASGTPGHRHAYWALRAAVCTDALEAANRRLAHHLGGDLASVDGARILRPPGTKNHKHSPPAAVELLELQPERRYELSELVGELGDPPGKAPAAGAGGSRRVARHPLDRALLAVPARDYVWMLAGLEPTRAGKVSCPFHEDRIPSLQLYEDGSFYCFGCRRGGSIYDFAASLWGSGTKRADFPALRARLASELGITALRAVK